MGQCMLPVAERDDWMETYLKRVAAQIHQRLALLQGTSPVDRGELVAIRQSTSLNLLRWDS